MISRISSLCSLLLTLTDNQGYQQTATHAAKNPKTNEPPQNFKLELWSAHRREQSSVQCNGECNSSHTTSIIHTIPGMDDYRYTAQQSLMTEMPMDHRCPVRSGNKVLVVKWEFYDQLHKWTSHKRHSRQTGETVSEKHDIRRKAAPGSANTRTSRRLLYHFPK